MEPDPPQPPQQPRPIAPELAPDPARSYERADPDAEPGMGKMDAPQPPTHQTPDQEEQAVKHRQPQVQKHAQINAMDDAPPNRPPEDAASDPPLFDQPDHSMKEEEPLGWDQAPTEATDPRRKRHPRKEGKGGTP